jgi:phospholipase C
MGPAINDKIKHVVVLMFENRSFDHILGAMPGVNGLFDEFGVPKPEIYNTIDPTSKPYEGNPPQYYPFAITPGASEAEYIPNYSGAPSFNHNFTAMVIDLYGPNTLGVGNGEPLPKKDPVQTTYPSINSGFVIKNEFQTGSNNQYSVMSYFEWGSMNVLHKLAKEFVVCDNWFCDMPGHTAPNRAFMHCATTGALGIDDNDAANEQTPPPSGSSMVYQKTIFEKLEETGHTWKMYLPSPNQNLDTDFLNNNVANKIWTESHSNQTNCTGVPLSHFCHDVQSGNLPFYSFIMCWNDTEVNTSMHPQEPVEPGENLLAGVYNTLRNSPYWEDTLLVVNFDENGGMYDHVQPPTVTPPYPGAPAETTNPNNPTHKFDYSILGVRVPALLISPWLDKGIESTQLQNTSILRYLQDKASPIPPTNPSVSFLTQRDRFATSIECVFDDFGRGKMRQDCINNLETYPNTAYSGGIKEKLVATEEQLAAPPIPYQVEITMEYIRGLPGHPDSGKFVSKNFATIGEMHAYVGERRKAAKAYYDLSIGK